MKKLVISGYYGFNNLGDEAILHAFLEGIKSWDEDLIVTVLSGNENFTSQTHSVFSAPRWPLPEVKKTVEDCDFFITGGGSLLQDKTGVKSIPYYLGLNKIARKEGAMTALFSCGVGPINRPYLRWLSRQELDKFDFLSVRDEYSRELLEDIGVKKDIEIIPDPVFLLSAPEKGQGEDFLEREGISGRGPRVIIAPRTSPGEKNHKPEPWIEVCKRLQYELGAAIIIWPMHFEQDFELSKAISEGVSGVSVLEGTYSLPRILEILKATDLVIGVRFHALLLGAVGGSNLLGISYDPKVKTLLGQLGLPSDFELGDFSPSAVALRAERILDGGCVEQKELGEKVENLREKARKGMNMLRDFIGGEFYG